jgi:ureidoglycolate dehydrogenase (NAD+)
VSHFFLALDPSRSMPFDQFTARVDELIDQVHASPPASGVARIYVPGERGYETAARREREGIPIAAKRLETLKKLAAEVGVVW